MLPPVSYFLPELQFQTSRSSGPGGQNVNKVESRVELRFRLPESQLLTEEQKQTLLQKLASRLTAEGELLVVAQEDRSQLRNKETALRKFHELLAKALHKPKARKATKPSKGAVRQRLESKKKHGEKKASRGRVDF
ncbi:alternative ribosome rescue aminoacyl-tRNA hydrolase ArfB [Hymenobacter psychrotolerans]|uniref:Ribosome-associated protein n=1 Tax=Hymenobacter psychrotolerans DSM 18569 TaxID=1121959 RepID=A0A1M6PFP3_9BACT|nr:alternative ribosome rescue aminoacyl-tRNA hydrolase ArfB [Hymenobacter psychrotolerans]SHK06722.1 ribosome-associated protein [Hymenobacter psychrotolerans DSM 18569]